MSITIYDNRKNYKGIRNPLPMLVMKFGGSSVKDAEMVQKVASLIQERIKENPVVVLSAVKGTTDALLAAVEEAKTQIWKSYEWIVSQHTTILAELGLSEQTIAQELAELKEALDVIARSKDTSAKMLDYILFFGERLSVNIMAAYLEEKGTTAKPYLSGDVGVLTDSSFGNARLHDDAYGLIKDAISKITDIPIITGFGGKDGAGEFTTFARGGSDYVAAILGAAIDAKEIQIWTDVDGVMTADPRFVEKTQSIPLLSFDEASQLAYFGAKVLHPKTIWPAIEKNIFVSVLNTYNPTHRGTKIVQSVEKPNTITALTHKEGIIVINVKSLRMLDGHGYLAKIFEVFARYRKAVDMLATSEVDVSMTVDSDEHLEEIIAELSQFARVTVCRPSSIIQVVGEGLIETPGMAARIFTAVGKEGINVEMISQCFNQISVGFLVKEKDARKAITVLHKAFIE